MNVIDRFLTYVRYDTMSDPLSPSAPSSAKQLVLARELVKEMQEIGVSDAHVDEYGVVYGWIPATTDKPLPAIGLIAHMDTAPDMSGENVQPRLIKNYDGGDIVLNADQQIVMSPKEFSSLSKHIGHDLIVTDGTTLLGADDKAGVAEIMSFAEILIKEQREHGKICIAFTPDEEVGRGTAHFDIEKFGADFAYTIDGETVTSVDYENFNAATANITINGKSIHPGSAKGKMVNALLVAMEFQQLLPQFENPACTEGYEGFHHLHSMSGNCEQAKLEYIIRNHDEAIFTRQKQDFVHAADFINSRYGRGSAVCEISDTYGNMRAFIEPHREIIDLVKKAMVELGIEPHSTPIRGGTDGAMLTYRGLLCPNLGTGGYQFHGKYEYACVDEMKACVQILLKMTEIMLSSND